MTDGWNFAEVWEHNAERFPDALAQARGEQRFSWREFDQRADGVAAALLAAGLRHQDKVAQYLFNCPEYLESVFASFKAGLVPVNTNYRYTDDELLYLWDNADVAAVIFHGAFEERCAAVRPRVAGVKAWLWVDDGSGPCPEWAIPYEQAAVSASERTVAPWGRSADDLYILYTGGTTGMPKGVMWRQDDMIIRLDGGSKKPLPATPGWDVFDDAVPRPGPRNLPAAPLMHGTGAMNAMHVLTNAGSVTTLVGRSLDVVELLDTVQRRRINSMSIVGDAFAKRIVRALDDEPDRWDISSLRVVLSSGTMWGAQSKEALLRHNARMVLIDSLGSSEAIGMGTSITRAGEEASVARFQLGETAKVITEDGREVLPGSGERGRVAIRGRAPVGYYKDATRSAATFVVIDGERWSIPGDWAEVAADGRLKLHGRGSQLINTGGEKVHPEEVEEALKLHPSVDDAAVVGPPDERFGQIVVALVAPAAGAVVDEGELVGFVRSRLAAFKAPKRILTVDSLGRAPNGKLDYRALLELAVASLDGAAEPAGA